MTRSTAIILALLLLTSCVIAPVPLVETTKERRWSGADNGKEVNIHAVEKTWYLPIVASPEGAAKLRRGRSSFSYYSIDRSDYLSDADIPGPKATRLAWLDLEVEWSDQWTEVFHLDGTPYWMALRTVDLLDRNHSDGEDKPKSWRYEIAVFDLKALKSKHVISRLVLPKKDQADARWPRWKYDPVLQALEFNQPSGGIRYYLLRDIEETIGEDDQEKKTPNNSPEPMPLKRHGSP